MGTKTCFGIFSERKIKYLWRNFVSSEIRSEIDKFSLIFISENVAGCQSKLLSVQMLCRDNGA